MEKGDIMQAIYEGETVLVTGHTGFKGSWLSLWLQQLNATTIGFSLPPQSDYNNFTASNIAQDMIHLEGDIRDFEALKQVLQRYQPKIVFHLAAQPLVLRSLENPKETFEVNAAGTVNLLEAVRMTPSVKAVLIVTTDKCYDNQEHVSAFIESDPLGGDDPYSASKCMAEHAAAAYRHSFFTHNTALATARAGNVIGGGDFSEYRILPDCMRALALAQPISVRHPGSVREWLYVLDCLKGYLLLAAKLASEPRAYASAWNFGGQHGSQGAHVQALVEKAIECWGAGTWQPEAPQSISSIEKKVLRINWEKAARYLNWQPLYTWQEAVQQTVEWHKQFQKYLQNPGCVDMRQVCLEQIQAYTAQLDHSMAHAYAI
jgi:CDP-glucose 4,6-dehydratase